jgi:hypothetical protein
MFLLKPVAKVPIREHRKPNSATDNFFSKRPSLGVGAVQVRVKKKEGDFDDLIVWAL